MEIPDLSHHPRPVSDSKTRWIAFVNEQCSGCGGAPACKVFCPTGALELVEDRENFPFKKIQVNSSLCIGCGSCIGSGPKGNNAYGCPWDAIRLISTQ